MFARFSTSRGTSSQSEVTETARFELKFHTERGDWDLIGNNIPVPDVRDAIEFDVFAGTRESSVAVTPDPDRSRWKFWAVSPEAAQRVLLLFADRGPPASARFMSGYGTQRFKLWNSKGRHSWVKFHLKTRQEKISFPGSGLANPPVEGPGCLARDLLAAIGSGCFPRWTLFIQVVPGDEVEHHDTSLFDPTEVWPPINRRLIEVGEVELNRNPVNYFAEVEQVAFEPLDIVPGLCLSPEAMPKEPAWPEPNADRCLTDADFQQLLGCDAPPKKVQPFPHERNMLTDDNVRESSVYRPSSMERRVEVRSITEAVLSRRGGTICGG